MARARAVAWPAVLDAAALSRLAGRLRAAIDGGRPLVLDLAKAGRPTAAALQVLIAASRAGDAFVLREGTDYGERDVPFETKVLQVRRQLERREAEIVFDPNTESDDIVVRISA